MKLLSAAAATTIPSAPPAAARIPFLDQQLDDQSPAPRTERRAHGDFPEALDAADEQQTGDVDARDQEEQR